MSLKLMRQLALDRCPHCGVDTPTLTMLGNYQTKNFDQSQIRHWGSYECKRCGGVLVASARQINQDVLEVFPNSPEVDESVPEKPKAYLTQAINSRSSPAGAVMLAASSVERIDTHVLNMNINVNELRSIHQP